MLMVELVFNGLRRLPVRNALAAFEVRTQMSDSLTHRLELRVIAGRFASICRTRPNAKSQREQLLAEVCFQNVSRSKSPNRRTAADNESASSHRLMVVKALPDSLVFKATQALGQTRSGNRLGISVGESDRILK